MEEDVSSTTYASLVLRVGQRERGRVAINGKPFAFAARVIRHRPFDYSEP
jgi:hypothetical protein